MIPLTVRSHFSLMWGVGSVTRLCQAAKQLGYDRLALTDTDNLYGLWPFLAACRREGLRPIIGAEVTAPDTRNRAVCLVEDHDGYRNLCRLLTRRHLADDFDLAADLPAYAKGLSVLTGSPVWLATWHQAGVRVAGSLPRRPVSANHLLVQTAKGLDLPLVAVPGSFFIDPGDAALHRLTRAIANNSALSRLAPNQAAPQDAWLASPQEYRRRFDVCPQAIRATHVLAERLCFTGPDFGLVMPPWQAEKDRAPIGTLRRAAYAGARRRYGAELGEAVVTRLEHELSIIERMGFASYFLVVRDIVRSSPRICGRGSGAASLVAYCLFITNVCPVKHNLYFERFLNPGRKDPPDIDVDFAWDERDLVIEGVLTRFQGHAAMVANHVGFKPRMAVREVAKVYGLTDAEISRVSKRLPWFWRADEAHEDLLEQLRHLPRTRHLEFPPPWPEILELARRMIGAPRYLSVHPGGVVITPEPIDHYVPIQRAAKGVPVIQWEKDGAEEAGLVKIDLLGNRSLGVIRDALGNVQANGIWFDERTWAPEDDFVTQEALAQGRTMGCFYIESPAMRLLQQKSKVGDFEHLVIHSSIIRPAANDYIRAYLSRLHGEHWNPIHPLLDDVLNETFGIMVYQEDVSRAAVALAGFSHAEADGLRKIMSKKDKARQLRDFGRKFQDGARRKGVPTEKIEAVWEMIMSFNGYSFCKPHSASYARVSFQAAYLKVHFPAEFMAAVISNQGGFYSTFAYVSEARRLGLSILPPDVNRSEIRWQGRDNTIRVGLLAVKGLGRETRERIIQSRADRAYQNPGDFFERVRPDEAEARALIHCGALDSLAPAPNRAALLWQWAGWQKRRTREQGLFALLEVPAPKPPMLPPEPETLRLDREFATLGFLCDRHPMSLYGPVLAGMDLVKARDLVRHLNRRVRFAGWLITGKTIHTKHGQPMEFLTFEDETGIVETTFFPRAYARFCHMLDHNRAYILTGKVEQDWGTLTLSVDTVSRIENPASRIYPGE